MVANFENFLFHKISYKILGKVTKFQRVRSKSSESYGKKKPRGVPKDSLDRTGFKGCYDVSWRARIRTRMYNSNSGSGCLVGHNAGKCIDHETRNKDCRLCNIAAKTGPKPKDCRKNYTGSSKSMESSVSEVLFGKSDY